MKLKKIIRSGVLETNSSSSHSVCISRGQLENVDKGIWDLDFKENGILYIPEPVIGFGRNTFKSNKCLMKLQYAYGLAFSRCPEKQYELTELVKKVTGAKEVVFEWIEDYKRKVTEQGGILRDIYVKTPEIDHESVDLFDEVFETEETLKNFIFNPKSWLYGGSDEEDDPDGFKAEWFSLTDEEENAIATIHFGGEIGNMDIELANILSEGPYKINENIVADNRIVGMYIDTTGEIDYVCDISSFSGRNSNKYICPRLVDVGDNKYALAVFPLNEDALKSLMLVPRQKHQNDLNTLKETIEDSGLEANVEGGFKTFPVTINSKTFGKLC